MNAFEAAEKNGKTEDLRSDLELLFKKHNLSSVADLTIILATYLSVTVDVPVNI